MSPLEWKEVIGAGIKFERDDILKERFDIYDENTVDRKKVLGDESN